MSHRGENDTTRKTTEMVRKRAATIHDHASSGMSCGDRPTERTGRRNCKIHLREKNVFRLTLVED